MHGFHGACLTNEVCVPLLRRKCAALRLSALVQVVSHLGAAQAARIRQLQKDLRTLSSRAAAPKSTADDDASAPSYVQSELDDAVASECPLCGEAMIESVGVPFIDDSERMASEWDI